MTRLTRRSFHAVAASAAVAAAVPLHATAAAPGELRPLGKTGLKVPAVGIGTNNFGGTLDAAGTKRVVDAAMDHGAILFDTADVYGSGKSEEFLGQALGAKRKNAIIATKFGNPMRGSQFPEGGASRALIMSAVETSLKRLGTDYIDLYQIHRPDPQTPIEETLRAMDDLVKQGKVRFIGHSNFTGALAEEAAQVAAANKLTPFISAQNHYSLLTRDIEADLVPAVVKHGLGVLPYFPLESGMLTGKYKRDEAPPEGSRLANWSKRGPGVTERFMSDDKFTKVEKLTALAEASGTTVLHMAFGWLLNKPYIGSVIAGATKPEQVESNVKAAQWRPSATVDAEIDKITRG
ncbi:MAG: aldo/keto reductase [Rhodospirillaceae bacterium]|nr:aldo/keto reductase [Rhodospirillaceae bacterium]